jgi:His/Glu/Gln/Arg/opine family amino acid ABC transporter permease subunit
MSHLAALLAFGQGGWGAQLLSGLGLTLAIAILAYAVGLVLGFAGALAELSKRRLVSRFFVGYAAVMRSLPELLVIFFLYFGGAFLLGLVLAPFGIKGFTEISGFWSAVVALGLVQGAYTSEVFRGAFLAVPTGLREAAAALGLHPRVIIRHITAPVAFRYAFPGLANLWMVVIKNTPLVSVVGLEDFIRAAGTAGQNTKEHLFFYGVVIAVYLVLSAVSMGLQARIERRLRQNFAFGASP